MSDVDYDYYLPNIAEGRVHSNFVEILSTTEAEKAHEFILWNLKQTREQMSFLKSN